MKRLYARLVLLLIRPAVRLALLEATQQGGQTLNLRKVVAVVTR
ncbi:hypothetical protein [Paraburkholderia agricolaris]|nr:hypothetical protein [Paraburkholderia agricolaris]